MIPHTLSLLRPAKTALLFLLVSFPQSAFSAVTVDITFSPSGNGRFLYTVEIANNLPEALSLVFITDAPKDDSILGNSITAPTGFQASYDPGLDIEAFGQAQFLEDSMSFSPGSVTGGFSFESATAPLTGFFTSFTAIDQNGEILNGTTNVIPEPASAMLGIAGIATLALRRRR